MYVIDHYAAVAVKDSSKTVGGHLPKLSRRGNYSYQVSKAMYVGKTLDLNNNLYITICKLF